MYINFHFMLTCGCPFPEGTMLHANHLQKILTYICISKKMEHGSTTSKQDDNCTYDSLQGTVKQVSL